MATGSTGDVGETGGSATSLPVDAGASDVFWVVDVGDDAAAGEVDGSSCDNHWKTTASVREGRTSGGNRNGKLRLISEQRATRTWLDFEGGFVDPPSGLVHAFTLGTAERTSPVADPVGDGGTATAADSTDVGCVPSSVPLIVKVSRA